MQDNDNLTREMVFFLIFISIIGNVVYAHTWIDDFADRSAWLAALAGIMLLIPFAVWILYLGKLCPQTTVFGMIDKSLGKISGGVLRVPFILINILIAVAQLNMFTEMIKVFFLPYTPCCLIMLTLVLISMMFISNGISDFARLVEILAVLGLFFYFTSFIFAFPNNFNFEYIIPVFDTSLSGFIRGVIFITGETSECLLLIMIIVRFIPDPFKHYKWVVYGIGMSGVVFSLAIMFIIAMLSPELAKRIAFGGVNAAKLLQIGDYVRGLEIFIFCTYDFIAVGKIAACMYCCWVSMQKIFGNKKLNLQLSIAALLILVPSLWLNSYNKAYFLAVYLGNYVLLPFTVLMLGLASISIVLRNKKMGSVSK
jgi:spore germination protein KB